LNVQVRGEVKAAVSTDTSQGSLFAAYVAHASNEHILQYGPFDRRRFLITTALLSPAIFAQIKTLETLSSPEDRAFNEIYAVGASFASSKLRLEDMSDCADEDFALVLESMLRFDRDLNLTPSEREHLLCLSRSFARDCVAPRRDVVSPFLGELTVRFGPKVIEGPSGTLSDWRQAITTSKSRFVHIIGPDFYSVLQALTDPTVCLLPEQLSSSASLMADWGVIRSFATLLFHRVLGPYEHEREFLRSHFNLLVKPFFSTTEAQMISVILNKSDQIKIIHRQRGNYSKFQVRLYYQIYTAVTARDAPALIDTLINLYCLDPSLPAFLDWEAIFVIVREHRYVDARSTFVTLLMNSEALRYGIPMS